MNVTYILKDLSTTFYEGNGGTIIGFNNLTDTAKFDYLSGNSARDLKITCKVGKQDELRDRIELNAIVRANRARFGESRPTSYKIEPRKGYKLVTFTF